MPEYLQDLKDKGALDEYLNKVEGEHLRRSMKTADELVENQGLRYNTELPFAKKMGLIRMARLQDEEMAKQEVIFTA